MPEEELVNPDENGEQEEEQEKPELEEAPIIFNPSQQEMFEGANNIEYIQKKLADNAPEQLISFLEKYNDKQAEIANNKAKYQHEQIINRENNRLKLKLSGENTRKLTIGLAFGIVISGFIYAGFTKDSALTDKIITALLGVGTGAGVLRRQDNTKPPKEK